MEYIIEKIIAVLFKAGIFLALFAMIFFIVLVALNAADYCRENALLFVFFAWILCMPKLTLFTLEN